MIAEKVLDCTIKKLELWDKGKTLDEIIDAFSLDDIEYRSKVASLLFTYFRNKAYIEYIIDTLVLRKVDSVVKKIISVALVQIFFQYGVAKEVAVDVAVDYSKKIKGRKVGGFVNAVLRNALRKNFDQNSPDISESIRVNLPKILLDKWKANFNSEELEQIILALDTKAPFTFRLLSESVPDIIKESSSCEINTLSFHSKFTFYKTEDPCFILNSEGIETDNIYIQDPATAMALSLSENSYPEKILDVCAAPGGKSLMLSELYPKSNIIAMDRSRKRLNRVIENIERTKKKNITALAADVLKKPFSADSFNLILIDAPCSNTGVIRRRPDVKWRFSEKKLNEIVKLQADILQSTAPLVKNEGQLIYSTCSIEKEENSEQVQLFLKNNGNFYLEKEYLLLPSLENDGAYGAVLNRK